MRPDSLQSGLLLSLIGRLAMIASGGAVSIMMARHYGAQIYGQWSTAAAYGMLVATCVEGGLNNVLMRDSARDHSAAGRALGLVVRGRLILGLVAVPAALVAAWLLGEGVSWWFLVALMVAGRYVEGMQSSFHTFLISLGYYRFTNILELARRIVMVMAVALAIWLDVRVHVVATCLLVLMVVSAYVEYVVVERSTVLDFRSPITRVWKDAFWFWAVGVLFWINNELDQLMLQHMAGDYAAGLFAVADRLVSLPMVIPHVLAYNIVPRMFRSSGSTVQHQRQMNASALLLAAMGALIAAQIYSFGGSTLELFFGSRYSQAVPVFMICNFSLLFFFLRTAPSWQLTTGDKVPTMAGYLLLACGVNVLGNYILIPKMGARGSAWATVASEAVMFTTTLFASCRSTGLKPLVAIGLGLVFGAVALCANLLLASILPWYAAAAGVCGVALALLGWTGKSIQRGWNVCGLLS